MAEKHARYSPSTLKSYAACPGYLPEPGESDASREGSFLHVFVENDMDETAARKKHPEYKGVELTPERFEWAQLAYDYTQGVIAQSGKGAKVIKEEWLSLKSLKIPGCEGGTADVVIICMNGDAHLIDYKFGWREVDRIMGESGEELKNLQFATYGLAALINHPEITGKITIHMVQPKLEGVDEGVMIRADMPAVQKRIERIVEMCMTFESTKDESMLRPDDELCGWCNRQANCPKWVSAAVAVARVAVQHGIPDSEKEFDPEMIPEYFTGWDPETADPVDVAMMLRCLGPLESFIRRFKRFGLEVSQSGKEVPGFKEFSMSGKTTVISPLDVLEVMENEFGCDRNEVIGAMTVSMDALKKLASEKAEKGKKGATAEILVEKLSDEGLIDRAPGYSYLRSVKMKTDD